MTFSKQLYYNAFYSEMKDKTQFKLHSIWTDQVQMAETQKRAFYQNI